MTTLPNYDLSQPVSSALRPAPTRPPEGSNRDHPDSGAISLGHRIQLTVSAEPAVVFASLAAQCVPDLCDSCVIEGTAADAEYQIAYPPGTPPSARVLPVDRDAPHQVAQLRFTDRAADGDVELGPVEGVATFVWYRRSPTSQDRLLIGLLIEQALRTVAWQRSEQRANSASARAENLDVALHTSRQIGTAIGILMSLHKITQEQAFDLLRTASQHSHRKLRELAFDVIDTGWLEPALLGRQPGGPDVRKPDLQCSQAETSG